MWTSPKRWVRLLWIQKEARCSRSGTGRANMRGARRIPRAVLKWRQHLLFQKKWPEMILNQKRGPRALGLTLELFFSFSSHWGPSRASEGVPSWYTCFRKINSVRRKMGCKECAIWWGRRAQAQLGVGAAVVPSTPPGMVPQSWSWPLCSVPSKSQAGTPSHRAQPVDSAPTTDSDSLGCLEKSLTLYKLQLLACFLTYKIGRVIIHALGFQRIKWSNMNILCKW